MDIQHFYGNGTSCWWMFALEMDREKVPVSMDKDWIHGRNILSIDLNNPLLPCNILFPPIT